MSKKKYPKGQNGYIIPEQQVYATYPVQPIQGYQQPQYLPVQQPQGQYLTQQQMPYQGSYTVPQDQAPDMGGGMGASTAAGSIAKASYAIGDVFDTIGDIRRGIITTGGALLNALIPDNPNKKARSINYVNSQDPYGSQTYNNMFENGGQIAQNGKTIMVNDKNDPRYRAYQDSLRAYNYSQRLLEETGLNNYRTDKTDLNSKDRTEISLDIQKEPKNQHSWTQDLYKDWHPAQWAGERYKMYENGVLKSNFFSPIVPLYDKPSQKVALNSFPPINSMGLPPSEINIDNRPYVWDNVLQTGTFPVYGQDNKMIGTWDQNTNGQTNFYPSYNPIREEPYTQAELRDLPRDTNIVPFGTKKMQNIRKQENGGKLSASKAKEILKDGTANGKKLTEKQKRYFGFIAGGGTPKAANGATVTNYGYNRPIPNLTPAQEAALNGFIPYTPEIQPIQQHQIQPSYDYFQPLDNGQFAINTQRVIADRTSPSGYFGDTYSYGTNRPYAFEGLYGNSDYQPDNFTGYNRMFQNGGNLKRLNPSELKKLPYSNSNSQDENVRNFYIDYINSPNYKQRLINQGYKNPNQVIKDRAKNASSAEIIGYLSNIGSQYYPPDNEIFIDKYDMYDQPRTGVLAHEMSHATQNPSLNRNDKSAINARNKAYGTKDGYDDSETGHDAYPEEFKADLDQLRYYLKRDGLHDTGKEIFNQEILNKAKTKYKRDSGVQRILNNVKSDADLIWLMNNIAANNTPNQQYAEFGTTLPINNTGYLQGASTASNPYNIIPSGIITMDGVNQGIYANGQYLPPNSGTYQFPGNQTLETKTYNIGDELDLSEDEISALRQQGYDIEIG